MGAKCVSATPTGLATNATYVPGYPFVFGCWTFINDLAGNYIIACLTSSAANTHNVTLQLTTTKFQVTAVAGGGTQTSISNITPVVGKWYYIMCRAISATNRWVVVFDPSTGLVDQVQNTSSVSPTFTTPRIGLGCLPGTSIALTCNDTLAEFFYLAADFIGAAPAAALPRELVTTLALEGPFSRPYLSNQVIEYRSLLWGMDTAVQADSVTLGLTYSAVGLTTWNNPFTAANVPVLGPHPPLSTNYARPQQVVQILVV
jgi:hypothetical protein